MTEEEFLKRKEAADTHDEEAAEVNIFLVKSQTAVVDSVILTSFFRAEIMLLNRGASKLLQQLLCKYTKGQN